MLTLVGQKPSRTEADSTKRCQSRVYNVASLRSVHVPTAAALSPFALHQYATPEGAFSQRFTRHVGSHSPAVYIRVLSILAIPFLLAALLAAVVQTGFAQGAAEQANGVGSVSSGPGPLCDPTWEVVAGPNPATSPFLNAIAVVSADDIWAVGYLEGSCQNCYEVTLVEHWDGSSWSVVPSPSVGAANSMNRLTDVAVGSATDIWAVGNHAADAYNTNPQSLIEHWDGSSWSLVEIGPVGSALYGVEVISASDAWAVGLSDGRLVEHWDGTQWTRVAMPPNSLLAGAIDAIAADDIWAVGAGGNKFLAIHWDGATWTSSSPYGPDEVNVPAGVAMLSANNVWLVGSHGLQGSYAYVTQTWIEHWDGSTWSAVDSPSPGTGYNYLTSVTAVSDNDIWAVGYYQNSGVGQKFETLIEHWDGSTWSVVASPSPGHYHNYLNGVAAVSTEDVWAVGWNDIPAGTFTALIAHYTPCIPTPTPTPAATNTPAPTPTPCMPGVFSDVPPDNTFYPYVTCLVNNGVISGYGDCTFRPYADITRGQIAKVVSNAAGYNDDVTGRQTYADVPSTQAFWLWIERLASHNVMGGYVCGGEGEPCDGQNRPYFRWGANATRGQLSKIVSNAAGYTDNPPDQYFTDVPPSHPFFAWIQRLVSRGAMSGYSCGGVGEPCDGQNRPYFRSGNNVTRGQASKIVANTFYPNCQTSGLR